MQPAEIAAPGLIWAAPFLGVLASIAVLPALAPRFWHRRVGVVAGFCIAALLLPQAVAAGRAVAAASAWHAVLIEYLPFITLLSALLRGRRRRPDPRRPRRRNPGRQHRNCWRLGWCSAYPSANLDPSSQPWKICFVVTAYQNGASFLQRQMTFQTLENVNYPPSG